MLGAIIGDIVGSIYEFHNHKSKDFEFFGSGVEFTDDSILTVAIAKALLESNADFSKLSELATKYMQEIGRPYPYVSWGTRFRNWLYYDPTPYGSFGNGAAMRVSAVGWVANSINEAKELARKVTIVSHDAHRGIAGAQATAVAIYLARIGKSKEEIKDYICKHYYNIDFTIDEIRPTYGFDETCQGTVPQALEAFFESESFEDAIRIAISVGGDSDTLAAITGGVAEAYYGIPEDIRNKALTYLDNRLKPIVLEFEEKFNAKK